MAVAAFIYARGAFLACGPREEGRERGRCGSDSSSSPVQGRPGGRG
jgi:hypothetical protein